jgi:hypothetical protein
MQKTKLKVESDSMLIWYPKIKDLPIPQPKTEFIMLTEEELKILYEEEVPEIVTQKVKVVCDKMGYPCFLRTDLASGKHSWKKSCFIDCKTELWKHIYEVVTFNLCAGVVGLNFRALVVREFISMDSRFTAFYGDMPVNPERRYFIKDGKVLCHHPYWIEEAIADSKQPSIPNWREIAKELNTETEEEIKLLTDYAKMVAAQFKGYWSVDFCKAKDGRWILIDMASGEKSWHPKCKFAIKKEVGV